MKKEWILLFLASLMTAVSFKAWGKDKEDVLDSIYVKAKTEGYRIEITRVSSARFPNTERFNPYGTIEVRDTLIKANLPFFGKAYSIPYGDRSGIDFEGAAENIRIEKKKKRVDVRFEVRDKSELYRFYIQLFPGGNASVNLNSNQRESISYSGTYEFFNEVKNDGD